MKNSLIISLPDKMAKTEKYCLADIFCSIIIEIKGGFAMAPEATEKLIGRITHYFSHLSVGIIELTGGELKVGDTIHFKGKHTEFTQTLDSMQIEHQTVTQAKKGKVVGIKVQEKVRENDQVFRV